MPDPSADFPAALKRALMAAQYFPESTYRVQFHAGFTFRDALEIVPYLHDLGITHCYASPLLQARPGSTHGYDITTIKTAIPELGQPQNMKGCARPLRAHALGKWLTIVPNHMGMP